MKSVNHPNRILEFAVDSSKRLMLYQILFFTGAIGFLAMALMGSFHGARGGGHHTAIGHQGGGHTGGGHHGHGGPQIHKGPIGNFAKFSSMKIFLSVSQMDIFAVCLGVGATGLLLPKTLAVNIVLLVAILIGLAFDIIFLKPIFNFALRFVSIPSEGLEGTVTKTATAVTKFDNEGRGLVRIILDAEEKQRLAILDENTAGEPVLKGEELRITAIDSTKNTCHVSRI